VPQQQPGLEDTAPADPVTEIAADQQQSREDQV
jgi:hypothetical protein